MADAAAIKVEETEDPRNNFLKIKKDIEERVKKGRKAFSDADKAQDNATTALYKAVATVYIQAQPFLDDRETIEAYIDEVRGIRKDKRKSPFFYMLELMKVGDTASIRSRYDKTLLLLEARKIAADADAIIQFIAENKGVRGCAALYATENTSDDTRGRRTLADIGREAIEDQGGEGAWNGWRTDAHNFAAVPAGYFVILAKRSDENGSEEVYNQIFDSGDVVDFVLSEIGRQKRDEDKAAEEGAELDGEADASASSVGGD